MRTDKVLCRDCNSRTGYAWDAQLAKQLLPFAQLVFPNGHRSGPKQRRVRDSQGNSLILKAGIRGGAEHPQSRIQQVGDGHEMTISAPTRQRAVQEIRRLVKEGKLPAHREEEIIQGIQREETLTRVMFSEAGGVGSEAVGNSWLKSMVTAGVLGGLTRRDMLAAVESLRGCGPAAAMFPIRESCLQSLSPAPIPIWHHCVHVEADDVEHVIWGLRRVLWNVQRDRADREGLQGEVNQVDVLCGPCDWGRLERCCTGGPDDSKETAERSPCGSGEG